MILVNRFHAWIWVYVGNYGFGQQRLSYKFKCFTCEHVRGQLHSSRTQFALQVGGPNYDLFPSPSLS
jgi:hypothetical protein